MKHLKRLKRKRQDAAEWISISELARRKGISPQGAHDRIKRLGERIELKPGRGRERLVNVAQYDRLTAETTHLPQAQAAATVRALADLALPPGADGKTTTIIEAQRQKLLYDAGLTAIKFAEARGAVLPIAGEHGVEQAMREVGDALRQAVGRLHLRAAELAAIAGKDGARGLRVALKAVERDVLEIFAAALSRISERGKAMESAGGATVALAEPAPAEPEAAA